MAQLRQDYPKFIEQDAEVIVIGPEGPLQFRDYWEENSLPFIGVPDPTHVVQKRYGQEVNYLKLGRMPAQVVVDKQGKSRFIHYGHSMSDIPNNYEILKLLKQLNREEELESK